MSEFQLPFTIVTTQEASLYIHALKTLQNEEFLSTKASLKNLFTNILPYTLSEKLQEALQKNDILDAGETEQKAYLEKLMESIRSLPLIKLTFAFVPTRGFLQECCDNITGLLKQPVLIDLTVDPTIIGGALISYNGKYVDLSIKHQIESL